MVLVMMLLAPAVMGFASAVERRLGAAAAGWVAALPVAFTITVIGVGVDAGTGAAALLALSAAGHVAAQIGFAVCAVAAIRRRDLGQGLMAGTLGYAAMSVLLEGLPAVLAAAAAIPALLAGPRLVASRQPSSRPEVAQRRAGPELLCLVAALIVGGAMVTSRLAGPSAAGAIAAFPVMSATLAISLGRSEGRLAAARALQGLVRSLPCYLTFCLVVATTAPRLPLPWSIALALTASVMTGRLTWKRLPVAVTPAPATASRSTAVCPAIAVTLQPARSLPHGLVGAQVVDRAPSHLPTSRPGRSGLIGSRSPMLRNRLLALLCGGRVLAAPTAKGRGHAPTIDSGWREVAGTPLAFVKRFAVATPA